MLAAKRLNRLCFTAVLLIACIGTKHIAAQNTTDAEEEAEYSLAYNREFKSEPLEAVLYQLLFGDSAFLIIGNPDKRITGPIRANSVSDAMQQLEDISDVLVVRRGDRFVVYSSGAEAELDGDLITYVYRARKARASDLLSVIENQEQAGFPQSNALNPDQHMSLEHHKTRETSQNTTNGGGRISGLLRPLGDFVEYQLVPNLNGLLLRGPIDEVKQAVEFLRVIDHPIPIVLIEVMIVQYNHTDGFTWRYNFFDGSMLKAQAPGFASATNAYSKPALGTANFGGTSGGIPVPEWGAHASQLAMNAQFGTLSGGLSSIGSLTSQFKNNLTVLMEEDLARIVTNPHISVINGQSGSIVLDEKFNFQNTVQTINNSTSQKADSLDAVTSLLVTPTVISPDLIHIAVNAELGVFTDIAGGLASANNSGELPGQRTNEIGTSVVLGEEETLIIGGLVKEQVIENRNRIPGLSRIPLLGHLFRDKRSSRIYTETVIYVTPHLAQPQGYEDQYREQVFHYSRDLVDVGEMVREQNRMDKTTSNMLYAQSEDIDHQQWKQRVKDRVCKPNCNCSKCRGFSVQPAAHTSTGRIPTVTKPESLPLPPNSGVSNAEPIEYGATRASFTQNASSMRISDSKSKPLGIDSPVLRGGQSDRLPNTSTSPRRSASSPAENQQSDFWKQFGKSP